MRLTPMNQKAAPAVGSFVYSSVAVTHWDLFALAHIAGGGSFRDAATAADLLVAQRNERMTRVAPEVGMPPAPGTTAVGL